MRERVLTESRYLIDERAAIMEFDGKIPRGIAEGHAWNNRAPLSTVKQVARAALPEKVRYPYWKDTIEKIWRLFPGASIEIIPGTEALA
jgi:hypothetical protein